MCSCFRCSSRPGCRCLRCNKRLLGLAHRHVEHVKVHEPVAGSNKRGIGLSLSKAVDRDALLADAGREAREVAVARDETEAGEAAGVQ